MRKLFILILLTTSISVYSQKIKSGASYKDYFLEGSYLLLEDNFAGAQDNFEAAYKIDSTNANVNYMLGICYLNSALEKHKAELFLARAIKKVSRNYRTDDASDKTAGPLAHLYYGQALHINYKFDEAIAQYAEFKKYVNPKDKEWAKLIEREKATSIYAKELISYPINVLVTNLGDSVNSLYPDYSPVFSADERMLIFTTRRPNTTGGLKELNGFYNEDVVVSYKDNQGKWSTPQSISPNINTAGMDAAINLSADGQTLILYKDGGEGMAGNIYYSNYDGKDWTLLKEFGSDVNSKYQESHACLNANGTVLFFVSDRPGGYGGKDIYKCVKLPNGNWSKAVNVGPTINTAYDEDGAFIHPDGITFFFSSNGHRTMGGYDIFFATLNAENKFSEVSNIGYPINTTQDDIFYVTSPDGKRSYLSSAKAGGFGEKDIYMISIPEAKEKPLVLFKGQILAAEGESLPEGITITVTDKQSGEIVGVYRPKLANGTFASILAPGKEYNFSYQAADGEEFYNEDVYVSSELSYQEIKHEIFLEPIRLLGKIVAKKKTISLNPLVLNNDKDKNNVIGSILTLKVKDGESKQFNPDSAGKYEPISLLPEKIYTLFAEANGKKSAVYDISTIGFKSGKVINQILYIENKPDKIEVKNILLDVIVKNAKNKKNIPNASVVITDKDGIKLNTTTNEKGVVKNIELTSNSKYQLEASSDESISEIISFTTPKKKSKKNLSKTLFIAKQSSLSNNNNNNNSSTNNNNNSNNANNNNSENGSSKTSSNRYEFYFSYNQKDNNETESEWISFIDKVVELTNKKTVRLTINSSASTVPCRTGNKKLASLRATNLKTKIKDAVTAKGGDVSKIKFIKKSRVSGPKYRGDFNLGRKKYEKFQFVKAKAK